MLVIEFLFKMNQLINLAYTIIDGYFKDLFILKLSELRIDGVLQWCSDFYWGEGDIYS